MKVWVLWLLVMPAALLTHVAPLSLDTRYRSSKTARFQSTFSVYFVTVHGELGMIGTPGSHTDTYHQPTPSLPV
ncbi:MAG: hypothetical protein OXH53_13450 [bacterium]|nr:hypothetical protein [bacterium]MCY3631209.1 hypothetical protein [bacterium]